MPEQTITRRDDRPTEGFVTTYLPTVSARPVRLFLPSDYQAKYAYPLLVLFHSSGEDEDAAARLVPGLSPRNYIAASLRGSHALGAGLTGRQKFGWGEPTRRDTEYLNEVLAFARRQYHVHSERIYFVGVGDGALAAYRLGQAMAGRVAGIVALNGRMPELASRPWYRLKSIRGTRIFIGHGTHNPLIPIESARRASQLMENVGADVQMAAYPTTHCIHPNMLRDVNRWIMGTMTADQDSPAQSSLGT